MKSGRWVGLGIRSKCADVPSSRQHEALASHTTLSSLSPCAWMAQNRDLRKRQTDSIIVNRSLQVERERDSCGFSVICFLKLYSHEPWETGFKIAVEIGKYSHWQQQGACEWHDKDGNENHISRQCFGRCGFWNDLIFGIHAANQNFLNSPVEGSFHLLPVVLCCFRNP